MPEPAYRRVIVKISGEALAGDRGFGIDDGAVHQIVGDLINCHKLGAQIGVVVGGGNLLRGSQMDAMKFSRPVSDSMGMMATVMNALVLEEAVTRAGVPARTMSALTMPQVCETYERRRALRHFDEGRIVIFGGGTGNPFFTTDTTAVLRAAEVDADVVLKATNVDGVYDSDPKKNPNARRYDRISHKDAIDKDLQVMDATAFALARENKTPIIVFSVREKGAIEAVLRGKGRATIVA
jgi:uridylate kinase